MRPPLLPGQRRGRPDHVAHAGDAERLARRRPDAGPVPPTWTWPGDPRASRRAATTPAPRSSRATGEIRSNVISSQGVHDRYGGVVPEVASRHHLELVDAVVDDALARAGATLDDVDLVAVTQGPGLVGALLVGVATRQGARRGARPAAGAASTTSRATSPRTSSGPSRSSRRSCAWWPAAGTRSWRDVDASTTASRSSAARSTTPPARRSTRARACSACRSPAARTSSAWPREGDPHGVRASRSRAGVAGLDFSFAGLKTALLYKRPRPGGGTAAERRAPTSRPPTSTRSSRRSPLRVERGLRADRPAARSRSAAAWRPTGRCASAWRGAGASSCTSRRASCAPTTRR